METVDKLLAEIIGNELVQKGTGEHVIIEDVFKQPSPIGDVIKIKLRYVITKEELVIGTEALFMYFAPVQEPTEKE